MEIVNVIDDHSRLAVASRVFAPTTAPDVLEVFHDAARRWGLPAAVLTDNGCVYTAAHRHVRSALESELLGLGITFRGGRPASPNQSMRTLTLSFHVPRTTPDMQPMVARVWGRQTGAVRTMTASSGISGRT